jgi:hypothetical protein
MVVAGLTFLPKSVDKLIDDPFRSLAGDCGEQEALPRIRRHSANSFGPTFYGGA